MADLEYSREGRVATILLNRPQRHNAFTLEMIGAWVEALASAESDPEVGAIVLRGAGDAFCAGIDLELIAHRLEGPAIEPTEMLRREIQILPKAAARLEKPYLAAISGPAIGAGLDMALACDMRLCAASARLGETYVRAGLVPGAGAAYYLPRLVGLPRAFELLATGKIIGAEEALSIGLVNSVHPDGELLERTYELAEGLAGVPAELMSILKRTLRRSATADLDTSLELVASQLGVIRSSEGARASYDRVLERMLKSKGDER